IFDSAFTSYSVFICAIPYIYYLCIFISFYFLSFFFFNDTATTEIYTLSLHDALPISLRPSAIAMTTPCNVWMSCLVGSMRKKMRSEEHTSELQSRENLVCRLLLEKKKKKKRKKKHVEIIIQYI